MLQTARQVTDHAEENPLYNGILDIMMRITESLDDKEACNRAGRKDMIGCTRWKNSMKSAHP